MIRSKQTFILGRPTTEKTGLGKLPLFVECHALTERVGRMACSIESSVSALAIATWWQESRRFQAALSHGVGSYTCCEVYISISGLCAMTVVVRLGFPMVQCPACVCRCWLTYYGGVHLFVVIPMAHCWQAVDRKVLQFALPLAPRDLSTPTATW